MLFEIALSIFHFELLLGMEPKVNHKVDIIRITLKEGHTRLVRDL